MPKLRMEASSDQYINIALNDIGFSVNTAISAADNVTAQTQTCPSSGTLGRPTQTKRQQCGHRSNSPTETNSSRLPWIHPQPGGREPAGLEPSSVTLGRRQGQANRDKTTVDGRVQGEHHFPHLTIATMKDVLHKLKHKHAKNCFKYEDTNNYLKDDDAKNGFKYEHAKNGFKHEDANNCLSDEDTNNCPKHEDTKNSPKNEDPKNCLKREDTKNCPKHEDTENCPKHEVPTNCPKHENPKNIPKHENTKNCLNHKETKNWWKGEDATDCLPDEDGKVSPELHEQDILKELQEQDAKDWSRLIHASMLQKLQGDEVVKECRILDTVKDIHLSNVQVLEQVGKSEPAVRRILGRHQLTTKDVKDVSIDEDIQAQVATFLRTNVTGNLLLTRVLRENYSIFHSWLTAHLQVERNAGVSRFKQALQMIDTERSKKLELTNILSDVANRIQGLLQACNSALSDQSKSSFHVSAEASMCRDCDSTCGTDSLPRHFDTVKRPMFCHDGYCCETHNPCSNKICCAVGRFLHSPGSGGRKGKPTSNSDLDSKRDLDTSPTQNTLSRQGKRGRKPTEVNGCHMYSVITDNCPEEIYEWIQNAQPDHEDKTCAGGPSKSGCICDVSGGQETGCRSGIPDSLNLLSSLCERLISDHTTCCKLIGLDPRQSVSLTEAAWVSLHRRCQSSCWDKPGMDRRLEALQQENRNLLNELNVLKSRLVDKNVEVLSLQNRLERLEAILQDSTLSTLGQCATREDLLRGNNSEIPRKVHKSSHHIKKICGDLLGSKHTTSSSNSCSSSANTGLSPVLQCSAITSNDRMTAGSKAASRMHPRLTASGDDSNSQANSIRGLTDKLQKQLHSRIREPGLDGRDRVKIDITHPNDAGGLQVDNVAQVQPNRSTTSRVAKKNAGEQTSWRHSLYVVQSLVKLKDGTDQGHAGVLMSAETQAPVGQPDSLVVPKMHEINGQPDSLLVQTVPEINGQPDSLLGQTVPEINGQPDNLVVQKMPEINGQPDSLVVQKIPEINGQPDSLVVQNMDERDGQAGATSTLSSHIPSSDFLANINHVTATTSAMSGSHKHQCGHRNHSQDSRSKQNKVQCRSNMSERDDEEKESSKMKTKCVLHANVVSLVSSMINDSTPMLPRTGQPGKATVSKCLRCQKVFHWADNHKLACSYHSEPLASPQKCDQAGRTVPVFDQWTCCLQPENSQGCCFGQHI